MKVLTTQSPLLVRLSLLTQSLFASISPRGRSKGDGFSSTESSTDSAELANTDDGTAVTDPVLSDAGAEAPLGTSRGLQKTSPDSNGTGKRAAPSN